MYKEKRIMKKFSVYVLLSIFLITSVFCLVSCNNTKESYKKILEKNNYYSIIVDKQNKRIVYLKQLDNSYKNVDWCVLGYAIESECNHLVDYLKYEIEDQIEGFLSEAYLGEVGIAIFGFKNKNEAESFYNYLKSPQISYEIYGATMLSGNCVIVGPPSIFLMFK